MLKKLATAALTLFVVGFSAAAHAQWGDVEITFTSDKAVPQPFAKGVVAAKCPVAKVQLENIVIDPTSLALANIAVFLDEDAPKIHPSYDEIASQKVKLDNDGCQFKPHLVSLWTKQTLVITNSDPIGHNSKVDAFDNKSINPLIPPGASTEANFPNSEFVPMTVSCNIHAWMRGYILLKDHPYIGASDKNGVVKIAKVPAGEQTFRIWHENNGFVKTANVSGASEIKKGRITIDVPDGGVAKVTVMIPSAVLQAQ
jgi:hypothetical protein